MPEIGLPAWMVWALLCAAFAALTAIFAKVGVAGIDPDLATFIRTVVILLVLGGILGLRGRIEPLTGISRRTYVFLALSGLATGRPGSAIFGLCSLEMPRAWPRSTS